MNEFIWYEEDWIHYGRTLESRGKLKYKFPMQQKVITVNNEIWEYYFVDGKILWHYYATFVETT